MSGTSVLNSTIPTPHTPFLNPDGSVSRAWLYYLLSILARTGGATGISSAALQQEIVSLSIEQAMTEDALPNPSVTLALADVMESVAEPSLDPNAAMLALALSGVDETSSHAGTFLSSTVLVAAAVSLTTATAADITSISLPAGTWNVWGNVGYAAAGTTVVTQLAGWTSLTSATFPTVPNSGAFQGWQGSVTANAPAVTAGLQQISLGGPATVYLSTQGTFTTSTLKAYGFLAAQQVS